MSAFRVLSYLLLALALVAGGAAPGFAQDSQQADPAAMEMPCHGMEGEPVAAQPAADGHDDCCHGADCRCDCLQHAPAGLLALRPLLPVQHARQVAEPATANHAPARTPPAMRPPIA